MDMKPKNFGLGAVSALAIARQGRDFRNVMDQRAREVQALRDAPIGKAPVGKRAR